MSWRAGAFLFTTMTIVSAVAAGCGSNSTVVTSPSQSKCQVSLSAPSSTIGPDGGVSTVTVTTSPECPWDASAGVSWLSGLSPTSGQGTATVQFQVALNPLPTARNGEIVVNDNRLRVSQQGASCQFDLRPGALTLDVDGGRRDVAVSAGSGCSWSLTRDVNWITFTTPVSGSGDGVVGLEIEPHTGAAGRSGTIALADRRVTVTQTGATTSCSYTVGLGTDVRISSAGGPSTVTVAAGAGCTWTAASSAAWITVTAGGLGVGNGVVVFNVAANPGAARTATVSVAGQTFTVTQAAAAAAACTYTVAPLEASIGAAGGASTVAVSTTGNCAWTATTTAAWLAVTSGVSGAGSGAVAFSAAANSGAARSGAISVAGHTFTVTQAGAPAVCSYAITPATASVAATAGNGTIAVATAGGCGWTAVSSASWITVTSGASGSGSSSVAFSVAANSGAARTGAVSVAGHTFTVTQAAGTVVCTYALEPPDAAFSGSGGNGIIAVSTSGSCAWTTTSNDSWIDLMGPRGDTGSGQVRFRVRANAGPARTGTISVANRTFRISQGATLGTGSAR